jgi:hypothetical protein
MDSLVSLGMLFCVIATITLLILFLAVLLCSVYIILEDFIALFKK